MSNEHFIAVGDLTKASDLADLADNPEVTLDVTELDLLRLPQHVKASLFTQATTFDAPQLQTSGYIDARSAKSFSAPQLQTSGYIDARSAKSFSAPQLQQSGDIYADSAKSFSAPQLQQSGFIDASCAKSFSAPQLQKSGDDLRAPKLPAPTLTQRIRAALHLSPK